MRLAQVTGDILPSRGEEGDDPVGADRRYDAAVADLRDLTRDRDRFPLVAEENAEYGFRRNCLGLRPTALAVGIGATLAAVAILVLTPAPIGRYLPTAAVGAGTTLFWCFIVRPRWVKEAADLYARRLLETLATLSQGAK
jgi:peptidoglycan/LPS O-acetylase OafA/YrhL